nr:MAG TPA: hypothetical protein [Caudoviricetes sp.]
MRPHTDNLNGLLFFQNLIHQTMLNIEPPRICALQAAAQFLIRWRILKRILLKNLNERLRFLR